MKDRLPVYIDNLELPEDKYKKLDYEKKEVSYGYVNILYILSLLITGVSIITILLLGK